MTMAAEAEGPTIRFRNYKPKSEDLQSLAVEPPPAAPPVEEQIEVEAAQAIHADATAEPLLNLAPKKVNWDLKRDVEPQMKWLRAMTDSAIIHLIRKRVAAEEANEGAADAEAGGPDLAAAVKAHERIDADGNASDEGE